jgi:hypothetical protein
MFEWWQVPVCDANRFWQALATSRYSRPTALRQHLALPGTVHMDLTYLVMHVLTPELAIDVVEDLVHELRLPRKVATRIEECILAQVTATGQWK